MAFRSPHKQHPIRTKWGAVKENPIPNERAHRICIHVRKFDVINGCSLFWAPCAVDWLPLKTGHRLYEPEKALSLLWPDFIVSFAVYYTGARARAGRDSRLAGHDGGPRHRLGAPHLARRDCGRRHSAGADPDDSW